MMGTAIVCVNCGATLDVPKETLGQVIVCPLCFLTTPTTKDPSSRRIVPTAESYQPPSSRRLVANSALEPGSSQRIVPISPPQLGGSSKRLVPAQEALLSLDDAPPFPIKPKRRPIWSWLAVLLLTVSAMGAVWVGFRWGAGEIPDSAWQPFAPDAAMATVAMPGTPEEIPVETNDPRLLAGKRFQVRHGWSGTTLEFGWIDGEKSLEVPGAFEQLTTTLAQKTAQTYQGKIEREAVVRLDRSLGRQVEIKWAEGLILVRYILVTTESRTPRVYVQSIAGKQITADSPATTRYFTSLRIIR